MFNNSSVIGADGPVSNSSWGLPVAMDNGRSNTLPFEIINYICILRAKFYINTLCAGPLCILGLAGNTVSFLVLRRDRESPIASFLLQSLSLTDNFFLAFWFLHFSLSDMFAHFRLFEHFHASWVFVRVYTYPLMFVGQTAMIWMTVLIAVSRYIAVCVPYKSAHLCSISRMQLGVILVLLASLLYNIPRYFELQVIRANNKGSVSYTFNQTSLPLNPVYRLVYFDILYYIFSFVLPLMLLAVLNTRLVVAYRLIQRKRQALRVRSGHDNQDNNITLIMIIVIVVFMVCNAPARIFQIVQKYENKNLRCWSAAFVIGEISSILEVLNSSSNFLVYCVFRKQFRHILRHSLCDCSVTRAALHPDPAKRPLNSAYKLNNAEATADTEIEL